MSENGKLAQVMRDSYYLNDIKVTTVLYATYSYQVPSSGSSTWADYLAAYDINSNGTLTQHIEIDFMDVPLIIAVFGQFIYNTRSGRIYQHKGGTSLTQNNYIGSADRYFSAFIANRGYLYATEIVTKQIVEFAINASTGSLTEFSGTGYPYATGTTSSIQKLSIDSDGKYLYAVDEDNRALLGYSIAPDGGLTKLNWDVTVSGIPHSAVIAKVRQ